MKPRRAAAMMAVCLGSSLVVGCTLSSDRGPGAAPATSREAAPSVPPTLADGGGLEPYYGQQPQWNPCGADDGFECAIMLVPLDYENPDGATLDIVVNRLPAAGGGDPIGSLIINPGGPGQSGLDYARSADVVTAQVRDEYDLVGFDPRGVGSSSPIDCIDDAQLDTFMSIDYSPDDATEAAALDQTFAAYAEGCEERSGDVLPFLGTVDVARDLDVLRAVLGDEKLNYLGKSYGTFIGSMYAEQFPENVGRMVLDGVVDPAQSAVDAALGQAAGFESALRLFLEDCQQYIGSEEDDHCPLLGDIDDGVTKVRDFIDQMDAEPIVTASGRELTQSLAVLGLAVTLYDADFGWTFLRAALAEIFENGTAENLMQASDLYTERQPDGTYSSNADEVYYAVNCLDLGDQPGIDEAMALRPEFEAASPMFGPYNSAGSVPCAHWPAPPTNEPHEITAPGAAPILVIGTTGDPATPYEASQRLADSLESGVLLTFEGNGHTAYEQGNTCIDEHVDTYFLTGKTPREGTTC